jgi:biotin transport system substrate-specific component
MIQQKLTVGGALAAPAGRALPAVVRVLLFAALTAAGAQVEIPNSPVPYTLQTLFVLLAGAILGPRLGAASMLVYLGAGALGAPVFASFGAGIGRLIGPTGGYLLAFPAAAFCVGSIAGEKPSFGILAVAMTAALLLVFAFGTLQLRLTLIPDWSAAFNSGFLIFSWWDVVKLGAAASIARAIRGSRAAPGA